MTLFLSKLVYAKNRLLPTIKDIVENLKQFSPKHDITEKIDISNAVLKILPSGIFASEGGKLEQVRTHFKCFDGNR